MRTLFGDRPDCRLFSDTPGTASPELEKVSTLLGQPVVEIVVSYFEKNLESISFVMATGAAFSIDETDYEAALRERFGEPLKGKGWVGEDAEIYFPGPSIGNPAVITLRRPSVADARAALVASLEEEARLAEQQKQMQLRKDL